MSKKQIAKRRAKRQDKKRAGDKIRRKAYKAGQADRKAHMRGLIKTAEKFSGSINLPDITDEDYIFWLCHGVNYLMSNAEEGLWEPMFEGIYEGNLPDEDTLPQKVIAHFPEAFDEDGDLSGLPMAVLAWTITDKSTMRIYRHEAEERVRRTLGVTDPDLDAAAVARMPHQPQVWDLINQVKSRSMDVSQEFMGEPEEAGAQEEA